jgi:hypothetical protein
MKTLIAVAAVVVLMLTVIGCEEEQNTYSGTGTVSYASTEGGFYQIVSDDGARFHPESLDVTYKKDGMRVYFQGVLSEDPASPVWGKIIDIRRISQIP